MCIVVVEIQSPIEWVKNGARFIGDGFNDLTDAVAQGIVEGLKNAFIGLLRWLAVTLINQSYWICLVICMIAFVLYLAGFKKYGKYVGLSFILFFILQSLKAVFL